MADSTTAVEIFKALDQDYALTGLRKLFGCMVDQLWKSSGSCSDTSNVFIQGLAWFNGGVLILAGIVACYLLYSMVADTANDGEAFGRSRREADCWPPAGGRMPRRRARPAASP